MCFNIHIYMYIIVVGVARLSLNDLIIPTSIYTYIYREQVMLELTRIYNI